MAMTTSEAIEILSQFALRQVQQCEPEEQIPVYQALAHTLESPLTREAARKMAVTMSEVAALQLELGLEPKRGK